MKTIILAVFVSILISCSLAGQANAIDGMLTGAVVTIHYTEPIDNEDGSVTNDLSHCELFYDAGAGAIKAKDIPASSLAGGMVMTTSYEVQIAAGQEADVRFWLTAVDTSDNVSRPSETFIIRIDRLATNAPR